MKQVVQNVKDGSTTVRNLPAPMAGDGQLLVRVLASLVSAGTERFVVELARKSLLGKARARPDHVRRILAKIRQEGLLVTAQQVMAKLAEPMPLGYSAAGIVLECGRKAQEFKPGDRVAVVAPHAEAVVVGKNLCARLPDAVSFEQGAYTSVAAIALEGVRLARLTLGERVLVIGLGLIGQITVALLKAQGCKVFGTDLDAGKLNQGLAIGADAVGAGMPREAVLAFSDGIGVDAVVITASTASNQPIEFAADVSRPKGRIVAVGAIGLNLPRAPFFEKELEFVVSYSLGPGRGDPLYEEKGIDYPIGQARWTARRNMECVLELVAAGKLPVEKLTTHRFPIAQAAAAYELITGGKEPCVGVIIDYSGEAPAMPRRVDLAGQPARRAVSRVGMIGAGNFARLMLLPLLAKVKEIEIGGICSGKGMNSTETGRRYGFAYAASDWREITGDEKTEIVFITTRHNLHAEIVVEALRKGKHVFVEKPLCLTSAELAQIQACVLELNDRCPILMVGFNRRFARGTELLRNHFREVAPLSISYRFAVPELDPSTWPQDEEVGGGRIIGEACHAIDTCAALAQSPPVRVYAESAGSVGGVRTTDDRVFITLRHENGSISNISYQAGGVSSGPTERIEIFGGGRAATLEGWDQMELWTRKGKSTVRAGKDKGHGSEVRRFLEACRAGGAWPIPWAHIFGSTWASLMAVQSLREGIPIDVGVDLSDGCE
jgi:predicted dehydrogenase/threonine dehydrogenase-like Zn-dependent dehydrogenase